MLERLDQHFLALRAQKKIDQQQRAVRMLSVGEKRNSAGDRRHQIHRNPCHRPALLRGVTDVAMDRCERYRHFAGNDQLIESRSVECVHLDVLVF